MQQFHGANIFRIGLIDACDDGDNRVISAGAAWL
jgi:hypothetical protein